MAPVLKWGIAGGSLIALGLIFWLVPREALFAGFASVSLPLFAGRLCGLSGWVMWRMR